MSRRPEQFYRGVEFQDYAQYRVTITLPGPRGGEGPVLIDAECRATGHDDACDFVRQKLRDRTKESVVG